MTQERRMEIEFEDNFLVMPEDTNANSPMIFGGAFFSKMDLCAAKAVRRLLYSSDTCSAAVTHKFDGTFHRPCYLGDLIRLKGTVVELRHKAVVVDVLAYRETKDDLNGSDGHLAWLELVAEAKFVFVSIKNLENVQKKPYKLPYADHGLKLSSS